MLDWFNKVLEESLFPLISQQFAAKARDPRALRVHDAFIVKYDAANGQRCLLAPLRHGDQSHQSVHRSLPIHVDQSSFSFTIALNSSSEYTGGGTWFEALKESIRVDCGHVLAFPGSALHGGGELITGVRYIIAAFLYYDEELLSRCDTEPA